MKYNQSDRTAIASFRGGFTIVELVVAVSLLLVVLVGVGTLFSSVTSLVQVVSGTNDVLQESLSIEGQIRKDIINLNPKGPFIVQCVAVRNNANVAQGGPLIDPSRGVNDWIRSDQLIFFASGSHESVRFIGGADFTGTDGMARSNSARISYGHGLQLPDLIPTAPNQRQDALAFEDNPLLPWSFDSPPNSLECRYWQQGGGPDPINGTQPEARDWILARQAVLLADDGDDKKYRYLFVNDDPILQPVTTFGNNSAVSLYNSNPMKPNDDLLSSRVDIAATSLKDLESELANGVNSSWRSNLVGAFLGTFIAYGQLNGYVRSEKTPPSMNRQDLMLTTPTLALNCSSFIVDWTWGPSKNMWLPNWDKIPVTESKKHIEGFIPSPFSELQWFGMPDVDRGVISLADLPNALIPTVPPTWDFSGKPENANPIHRLRYPDWSTFWDERIWPPAVVYQRSLHGFAMTEPAIANQSQYIEGNSTLQFPFGGSDQGPIKIYTAVFGFNGDTWWTRVPQTPMSEMSSLLYNVRADDDPPERSDFTAFPSALRITMILNDPEKRLEQGRTVQFIINLPSNNMTAPPFRAAE